jgi:hypothetical protein
MSANIEEKVVRIDASTMSRSMEPLIHLLSDAVEFTDSGVVDVFRILVRDDLASIGRHAEFYERLLHSALSLRVIVLCETGRKPLIEATKDMALPDAIINAPDRVRIIIVEDNIGVYFGADRGTPEALAVWPRDADGSRTIEMIEDALRIPEVFSDLFARTKDAPYRAFSVGTRQAWFGGFPTDAIKDAFREVGRDITGDDNFSALERRPPEWEVPDHLNGAARETDLLRDGEGLKAVYDGADSAIADALSWFGLATTVRIPLPKRVARAPKAQIDATRRLADNLRFVDETVGSLIASVEASDGFSDEEATLIEDAGIRLYRDDDQRAHMKGQRAELLRKVLEAILDALSEEQAITPYFGRLDRTIDEVTPRTSEEIKEAYAEQTLAPLTERLDAAPQTAPSGGLFNAARKIAQLLAERWFQACVVAAGVLGLIAVVDLIIPNSSPLNIFDDLGVPKALRDMSRVLGWMLFIAFVLGLIVAGALLYYADKAIRSWGRTFGFGSVKDRLRAHEEFICSVALNDWILSKVRRSAVQPLGLLRDSVLGEVTSGINDVLISGIDEARQDRYDEHSFNPAVRKTFQAGAQVGIYKNLPQVKRVLAKDVVWIIRRPIEAHGYSLLGSNAADVSERITAEINERLRQYVQSVFQHGVYSKNHLVDEHEGERERQKLMDEYWNDAYSINELLHGVVLASASDPMVQFVHSESLAQLDSASDRCILIRFAPRTAKLEEMVNSSGQRETLRDVTFTRSSEIGGVLRLIGYREGALN